MERHSLAPVIHILLRWATLTISLFVAYLMLPGIRIEGNAIVTLAIIALLLGLVNALVGPLVTQPAFGSMVQTASVFVFVVNALILWLAIEVARSVLRVGIEIDGFLWAFLGAIVITVLSEVLTRLLPPDRVTRALLERPAGAPPLSAGEVAKRLLALIPLVLCVVLCVSSLAGIVGLWVARVPLINGVVTGLSRIEPVLEIADKAFVRVNAGLRRIRGQIERTEAAVTQLGADVTNNRIILTVISNTVGTQLLQTVVEVGTTVSQVAEVVQATNSTLEAVNALPFASAPTLPDEVSAIVDRVANLEAEAKALQERAASYKADAVGGVVAEVTSRTQRMDQAVGQIEAITTRYGEQVVQARQAVAAAKMQAPAWITGAVIIATLALAWFAFTQAVVFSYIWSLAGFRPLFRGAPVRYSPDGG